MAPVIKLVSRGCKKENMEDATLTKSIKKSLRNGVAVASQEKLLQNAEAGKQLPQKVTQVTKKPVAPKVQQKPVVTPEVSEELTTESVDKESSTKGIFVGLDENGEPFFRLVGKVSNVEYLALVKYADMQIESTLQTFVPTSNLNIMKALKKLGSDKEKLNTTETA